MRFSCSAMRGELRVALLELGLELLLRALGRRRVAQDALGVHEADLALGSGVAAR